MKTQIKFFSILFIGLTLFSCNSESNVKKQSEQHKVSIKDTTVALSVLNFDNYRQIQTFDITLNREQIIRGKQGTIITFPKECFGKVQGNVTIQLIECYSIQDMLLNGLTTITQDGEPLETDGMIYLNALSEQGDTLKIASNKKVIVKMPTRQIKPEMQLFKGLNSNNIITWNLTKEKLKHQSGNYYTEEKDIKHSSSPVINDSLNRNEATVGKPTHTTVNNTKVNIPEKADKDVKRNRKLDNDFYEFAISSNLGWINVDRFIFNINEMKPLYVSVVNRNASYFIVLKEYNTILIPQQWKSDLFTTLSRNMPVSASFTIIGFGMKDQKIYFNMSDYIFEDNKSIDFPALQPISKEEMSNTLHNKFGKDLWSRPSI